MKHRMQRAFSLVELIFVIVVMGILARIASNYMPDNRLTNDTHYIAMQIKHIQKNAIGYEAYRFGQSQYWDINNSDNNATCVVLSTSILEGLDKKGYSLSSTITANQPKFCFDSIGRPYTNNQLLSTKVDINVTYNNKNNTISVLPYSGYVIIK
ncbi:MAG: type II secretion system protein [Sulfurospirillaceae bacterium]|nr:type II secretion system protein [Sulfurospirillaceae bacterium]